MAPKGNRNSRKHGAYAFRDHGSKVLDVIGRSRMAELAELVQTRPGMLGLLEERVVNSLMMCEIMEAFIVKEHETGKSLNDIPALGKLPAHQNTALRCVLALLNEMPGDEGVIDAAKILSEIKRKDGNDDPETENHG